MHLLFISRLIEGIDSSIISTFNGYFNMPLGQPYFCHFILSTDKLYIFDDEKDDLLQVIALEEYEYKVLRRREESKDESLEMKSTKLQDDKLFTIVLTRSSINGHGDEGDGIIMKQFIESAHADHNINVSHDQCNISHDHCTASHNHCTMSHDHCITSCDPYTINSSYTIIISDECLGHYILHLLVNRSNHLQNSAQYFH